MELEFGIILDRLPELRRAVKGERSRLRDGAGLGSPGGAGLRGTLRQRACSTAPGPRY
jgi:hypothetical protein